MSEIGGSLPGNPAEPVVGRVGQWRQGRAHRHLRSRPKSVAPARTSRIPAPVRTVLSSSPIEKPNAMISNPKVENENTNPAASAAGPHRLCPRADAIRIGISGRTHGFSLLTGADLNLREEWSVFLFQALLVAAPFAFLALSRVTAKAAWITGASLTAMFWGLYFADGLARRGAGGANIGLGLLLLVSPIVITAGAFAAAAVAKRRR